MFLASAAAPYVRGLLLLGLAGPFFLSGCLPSVPSDEPLPPRSDRRARKAVQAVPSKPLSKPPKAAKITAQERAAYTKQVLEPALATIQGRVSSYSRKLEAWQQLGKQQDSLQLPAEQVGQIVGCRNTVADLQQDYKGLQEQLRQEKSLDASRKLLFTSLQAFKEKDIAYLEGDCPQLFEQVSTLAVENKESANPKPAKLPPPVIHIDAAKTENAPAPEIQTYDADSRYERGLALLQVEQEQEARRLFSELLVDMRQRHDQQMERKTLAMLADLDFAFRDYAAAQDKYEELRQLDSSSEQYGRYLSALAAATARQDELAAYADLLRSCLTYNPDEDGFTVVQQAAEFIRLFPDSPLTGDAETLSEQIGLQAEDWFAALLDTTEQLLAQGKTQEAADRLEMVPLDILPLNKQDMIQRKKEELAGAAKPETQEARSFAPDQAMQEAIPNPLPDPADALQDLWNRGVTALEQGQYQEAVSLLSKLSGTTFAVKAEGKIKEAEQQGAEALRAQAAELFQQAEAAPDAAAKAQLLHSSKSSLEDILRKYPRSGMEDKIRRNLNSVKKELTEISGEQAKD